MYIMGIVNFQKKYKLEETFVDALILLPLLPH